MKRNIMKIVLFGLLLNIATGIMMVAVTNADGEQVFREVDRGRIAPFQPDGNVVVYQNFEGSISPEGELEDKALGSFRLLDMIGLGWIKKIVSTINHYLFGFVKFLDIMFGTYLNTALSNMLFGPPGLRIGMLHALFTIGYIVAVFEIWTNRKLAEQ